jgi:hypothetical protein
MENEINLEMQGSDLAKDTFLEKWPNWLRWVLFLPSTMTVSVLAVLLFSFFVAIFDRYDLPGTIFHDITSSLLFGAIFIYIGSIMAPKKQFIVSLILMIIISIYAGLSFFSGFYYGFEEGWFLSLVVSTSIIIGAVNVVLWIKNELK